MKFFLVLCVIFVNLTFAKNRNQWKNRNQVLKKQNQQNLLKNQRINQRANQRTNRLANRKNLQLKNPYQFAANQITQKRAKTCFDKICLNKCYSLACLDCKMECKNEEFKWACENKCVKKGVCPKFVETPQICKKCMKECKKDVKVSAEEVKTKCQPVCKNECWGPKWETSVCKECFKGKCVESGEVFKFVEGGVQGNGAVLVDEVKR